MPLLSEDFVLVCECVKELCYRKWHMPTHKLKNTLCFQQSVSFHYYYFCAAEGEQNISSFPPQDTRYPSLHISFYFILIICNLEFNVFFFLIFFISQTRKRYVGILFVYSMLCCIVLCLVHFVGSLTILYHLNHCFFQ